MGVSDWKSLSENNFNTIELNRDAVFKNLRIASRGDSIYLQVQDAVLKTFRPGVDEAKINFSLSRLKAY